MKGQNASKPGWFHIRCIILCVDYLNAIQVPGGVRLRVVVTDSELLQSPQINSCHGENILLQQTGTRDAALLYIVSFCMFMGVSHSTAWFKFMVRGKDETTLTKFFQFITGDKLFLHKFEGPQIHW